METGYLVSIRTEMASGVDLTDGMLTDLNAGRCSSPR